MANSDRLFPALLKYWRGQRGVSQLDLALTAGVSARHISFMETGRSSPSRTMVLTLGAALDVPLRDQNTLLTAAGFSEQFEEPGIDEVLAGPVGDAVHRMMAQHAPYPMMVMNAQYDILRANNASMALISGFSKTPEALKRPANAFDLLFDPELVRPFVVDWKSFARGLMTRLHREALSRGSESGMNALIERLMQYPDVPPSFAQPDFSLPNPAVFTFRLRRGEVEVAFLTTVTQFNVPQNVTLEELIIESYFPLDEATRLHCELAFA